MLAANCSQHQCRGITRTPLNDLKRLTARARSKGALSLRYVDKTGKVRDVGATQADLFFFMVEVFSFDAAARSRLPGAIRSALAGDPYPLGRLFAPAPGAASNAQASSDTLYLATRCTEESFPWLPADSVTTRKTKAMSALSAIAATTFDPFTPGTSLTLSDISFCVYWPAPTVPVDPTVTAPPPNIPVLILSGQEDNVTPAVEGKEVATLFPQAKRVGIPFTGHSVISDVWPNATTCVARSIASFFGGGAVASCPYVTPFFKPVKQDPVSLAAVKRVKLAGIRGRTVGAVLGTLSDVTMTELSGTGPTAGLRGGFFKGSVGELAAEEGCLRSRRCRERKAESAQRAGQGDRERSGISRHAHHSSPQEVHHGQGNARRAAAEHQDADLSERRQRGHATTRVARAESRPAPAFLNAPSGETLGDLAGPGSLRADFREK